MILNIVLACLAVGWAVNTAVFQARGNTKWWVANAALSFAALAWLIVRLS